MTFAEAQQEFEIRYYYWAKLEFEKEIHESFPNLRLFKCGDVWSVYQFMQQLERNEQLILAHSLLKRFNEDAVKAVGESSSDKEISLLKRADEFRSQFYGMTKEAAMSGRVGEKLKFVSKSKLKKIIIAKFTKEFGDQGIKIIGEKDWDPWFEMKIAGWIVSTKFEFGRQETMIEYGHGIYSEKRFPNPIFPPESWGPAMMLGNISISFAHRLGISASTEWKYPTEEDVELASDLFIKFCGQFFEVVPKLLKGIEYEKVTAT